jgi:hypothetical protein
LIERTRLAKAAKRQIGCDATWRQLFDRVYDLTELCYGEAGAQAKL